MQKINKKILGVVGIMLFLPIMVLAESFWVGVFAKGTPYTDQTFTSNKKFSHFKDSIETEWNNGFDIIDISYGDDRWSAVYAKGTGYTQQAYTHQRDLKKFRASVAAYKQKGFELLNIENGAGEWFGVFVKGSKYTGTELEIIRVP
jgi:hypothetical protein